MPFCYSPWTNIDINPQGVISPCCKFQIQQYAEKYNVQSHDIGQYLNSDFLAEVRDQFEHEQWPRGCERCRIEEQNNIVSKRQLDQQRWQHHYDRSANTILTASVAFGNTCNLKCITCNSMNSSRWHQEYQDIYGKNIAPVHFYKQNFVKDFVSQVPNLVHLDIPGGEPLLSGVSAQMELLDYYIGTGQAAEMVLHYTTNVTVYPSQDWWNRWQHFEKIDLQLSLDGIGRRYEYIRNPADWHTVTANIDRYKSVALPNFELSVSHTVSAYNIFYLDEFVQWCHSQGLPRPWMGRVHNPAHMRPSVWPAEVRAVIAEHLKASNDPEVGIWAELIANTDDSQHWQDFKKYLQLHDQYRGTDFADVFPELAEFIK